MPIEAKTLNDIGLPGKYEVFIETGYYKGAGVAAALQAGFQRVYSVELSRNHVMAGRRRYRAHPVSLLRCSSPDGLRRLEAVYKETPCVFWLDAHSPKRCPLIEELDVIHEVIRGGGTDEHVILIDDRRLFLDGTWSPITEGQILKKFQEMVPGHRIAYLPGYVPEDIIAALPALS